MTQRSFYVDACIYLNLWQKEGDERLGIPYWKIAQDFFEKFDNEGAMIYYSSFLLKELKFILKEEEFNRKRRLFESSPNFGKVLISESDLIRARKMESELRYEISFYDLIHLLLAVKTFSILITRDKKLLAAAKQYGAEAKKPEELL